jgi:hypothetical protein
MKHPMQTNLLGKLSVLALALPLAGCSGAYWGNLIVLGVSFGIFYGTLSLGRSGSPTRTQPEGAMSQTGTSPALTSMPVSTASVRPSANT